ncbi:hypothetical protein OXI21_03060 [Ignatzschineria sp. RMDPL8A]|nr:hypothetical protein [Ignatzschineria sp. RMDPL8A]MDG9729393.1 hypothetical protein [Ignatzschineria sp. RMDPL8A]
MFLVLLILIFGLLGYHFFGVIGVIISTLIWLYLFLIHFKKPKSRENN